MMDDVLVIIAVMWAGGRGGSARKGSYAPANRSTNTGTTSTSGDRSDHSPSAGTDQAAPQRPLGRIVWVRKRGACQHQPSPDYAGYSRLLCHSFNSQC